MGRRLLACAAVLTLAGEAMAQDPPPSPPPPASADTAPLIPAAKESDVERRLKELEASNARLREEVNRLREDHESLDQRVEKLLPLAGKLSGYVDFGLFYVQGDGSGIRPDTDHKHFPAYSGVQDSWVFMGDPLSTAINARGEPATTEPS